MNDTKEKQYRLTIEQRKQIKELWDMGLTQVAIAHKLGLFSSAVSRELKQGRIDGTNDLGRRMYDPFVAQERIMESRKKLMRVFSEEERLMLAEMWERGVSARAIGKYFGTNWIVVRRELGKGTVGGEEALCLLQNGRTPYCPILAAQNTVTYVDDEEGGE
ncbi:MAG: helix-turn-helix domain-containing protein [Oscillospiraceae bacterium]|nr:helix-turn-helix domain-containing protein [Oscillospiraceae bacterium]